MAPCLKIEFNDLKKIRTWWCAPFKNIRWKKTLRECRTSKWTQLCCLWGGVKGSDSELQNSHFGCINLNQVVLDQVQWIKKKCISLWMRPFFFCVRTRWIELIYQNAPRSSRLITSCLVLEFAPEAAEQWLVRRPDAFVTVRRDRIQCVYYTTILYNAMLRVFKNLIGARTIRALG